MSKNACRECGGGHFVIAAITEDPVCFAFVCRGCGAERTLSIGDDGRGTYEDKSGEGVGE